MCSIHSVNILNQSHCSLRLRAVTWQCLTAIQNSHQLSSLWYAHKNGAKNNSVFSIMPKGPVILLGIQMERSVSVPSDRNIRDHLLRWSPLTGRTDWTEIFHSIWTNRSIALSSLLKGLRKRNKNWFAPFLLVGPAWSENVVPFPRVFPLVSDRSAGHNGKHP